MTPKARKKWEREHARFLQRYRLKVLAQPGIRVLAWKITRPVRDGHRRREHFELLAYRAPGAPRHHTSYVVLSWRRLAWEADSFITLAEARAHYDMNACAPAWLEFPQPDDDEGDSR